MLFRYLLVYCLLQLLLCSNVFSRFKYSEYLKAQIILITGDSSLYTYRYYQIKCESNFNITATSDFTGWKKQSIDTITAITSNWGAAGLCQFTWNTAKRYGVTFVSLDKKDLVKDTANIYNPYWSIRAMVKYIKDIHRVLLTTKNIKARKKLQTDKVFRETIAIASYNTGEYRLLQRLNKYTPTWEIIKYTILPEPRLYTDKILAYVKANTSKNI